MGCDGCSHQFRVNEQTISLEGGLPMLLEDDFALGTSSGNLFDEHVLFCII